MKNYRPTTPSRRHMQVVDYRSALSSSQPKKSLTRGRHRFVGRNHHGRITTRHKGGGEKRLWRDIDFHYKIGIPAKIVSIEYDPNRTGFIGLALYQDGEYRYHLMPSGMKVGDEVLASETAALTPGNRRPLHLIPSGTLVYNVEIQPGAGAKLIRGAGSRAEVLAQEGARTQIRMASGEIRAVNSKAWASIGHVSNEEHGFVAVGKAGRSRHKGIRPTVRGSAMNPVDHPYGGGEGRAMRGTRRPKNLWGKGTRGVKTRRPKKYSSAFILSRRTKN
ncbi:MAG: 50S ribosomal protein L2 [Candidatus Niyogibacteria bacterium]|nr:50S ribosomal protein L2 [Candidatus Niyogibacteria bacterium]